MLENRRIRSKVEGPGLTAESMHVSTRKPEDLCWKLGDRRPKAMAGWSVCEEVEVSLPPFSFSYIQALSWLVPPTSGGGFLLSGSVAGPPGLC